MKNRWILYSLLMLIGCMILSCYDDNGNYDYQIINEVGIKVEKEYGVRKVDTVFVIRPDVKQTLAENQANLKFEWYYNTFSDQTKGNLISRADTVAIAIHPDSAKFSYDHFLRLYVKDSLTGAEYLFPVKLKVIKPYEGAWAVLHEDMEGTKLGAVEYIGEKIEVTNDAYFKERGRRLRGRPSRLGIVNYFSGYAYPAERAFFCFTDDPNESGILLPDKGFVAYDTVAHFIYTGHAADFDITDIKTCEGEMYGRICISNGHLFQGMNYNAKTYKVKAAGRVTGDIRITHGTSVGWTYLVYDEAGRRFLHFRNDNYSQLSNAVFDETKDNTCVMDFIKKDANNVNDDLLEKGIPENQKMVYMGTGYWYGPAMMARQARVAAYAVTVNDSIGYTYVYEFHGYPMWGNSSQGDYPFTYSTSFKTPSGMTTKTLMASSVAYNRLMFYAVDNKIYRLDFGAGGTSTLIYQHPDPGAQVAVMEFARKDVGSKEEEGYNELYADYGYSVFRSLGVGFNLGDGTGELVILNLNKAGKVDKNGKYPSVQQHKGFGKITDAKFL